MGSIGYFSHLIPRIQHVLAPLHTLTGSNVKFNWTEKCQYSFDQAKKELAKLPIVHLLRPDRPVHVSTDAAAGQFVAYSLWQKDGTDERLIPIKHNSHKLSDTEKNLSQFEAEGLAIVFCLGKEEALLSFGNLILHTDCRGLTFISKFANASSKISRWDLLIRSFNMTVHFLSNKDGLIRVTDLFTRNSMKGGQKNKRIRSLDLKDFLNFDFSGIPDLNIVDAMQLIEKIQQCFQKCKIPVETIQRVNSDFLCPPTMMSRVSQAPEIFKMAAGGLIAQVVTCTDPMGHEDPPLTSLPSTENLSVPTINWDITPDEPIKIREILSNYLCNISIENLIGAQQNDAWISKLNSKGPLQTFIYQGIVMTKNNCVQVCGYHKSFCLRLWHMT